ncbi:hypothetical protein [Streptomyces sp. CBMA123]|uniref:hypothetical protein n=1 Tax=Streptomyces sp. CBMA123 TaxID=1896313 RepID=UPI0016620961|nr:hypothetical protein [Streptomyces sp. CBMA123]MBD0692440.1 hypothetical protein [Streptomyces sp. CBMA123]
MTTAPTHADLALWLVEAAEAVSGIATARHTAPPSRSHLHPVLGPLTAGPKAITALADRLEHLQAARLPTTPASLFTLASYVSALGWLTESLADLTQAVDLLVTEADQADDDGDSGVDLSAYAPQDRQAITVLAAEAALPPGLYLRLLGRALLACAEFTEACAEIIGALTEDAHRLLDESVSAVRLDGEGPDSLPTLVRSLLSRLEEAR